MGPLKCPLYDSSMALSGTTNRREYGKMVCRLDSIRTDLLKKEITIMI